MTAERCWKVNTSDYGIPEASELNPATTRAAQIKNCQLHCDYDADIKAYEQRVSMVAAIIRSPLTPTPEFYVKGMLDPIQIWAILKEKLILQENLTL